jgi:hypothetical protein
MLLRFDSFVSKQTCFFFGKRVYEQRKAKEVLTDFSISYSCWTSLRRNHMRHNLNSRPFPFIRGIYLLRRFSYFPPHTTLFIPLEYTKYTYRTYGEKIKHQKYSLPENPLG